MKEKPQGREWLGVSSRELEFFLLVYWFVVEVQRGQDQVIRCTDF